MMDVIPAIDIKDGRCVRLLRGEFDAVTDYSGDALGIAERYAQMGCRRLHIVDLDGAASGNGANATMIRDLVQSTDLEIQLGGGIRTAADVESWLTLGVRRCVVGSRAVEDPNEVESWLTHFGPDQLVLALDVRLDTQNVPYVTSRGWTETTAMTLAACLEHYDSTAPQHVLCTDIARDGAMVGPNAPLYGELVRSYPSVEWQASGGIRDASDLHALAAVAVAGAITGKAMLEQTIRAEELQPFLPAA